MEKDFLLYLLYTLLIGIRERSRENNDELTFRLCDLLHSIPLQLAKEEDSKDAYHTLCDDVKFYEMQDWLNKRIEEFNNRNPKYKDVLIPL